MLKDTNNQNKRLAKNSLFLSIRMVIVLFIAFFTTRKILAVLGVSDFGVFSIVCGFISMFGFINTSMSNGIQRYWNFELSKHGILGACHVYNMSLIIQMLISIIVLLLIETLGVWYFNSKMVIPTERLFAASVIFQFAALSFVMIILQAPYTAAVMAHEDMDVYSIITVLDITLKLGIVFSIELFESDKLIIYGLLWMLVSIFDLLIYIIYCRCRYQEVRICIGFHRELFSSMLTFSGWNLFGSLSNSLKAQGVNLVMNLFGGPAVNAAFGVANQVNGGLMGLIQNLTIPVRPQVVKEYAIGNLHRVMRLTKSISKLSSYFYYVIAIPVIFEIDFILKIWLGENTPSYASGFVIIILITSFVGNLNAAISNVVHAIGDMKLYQSSLGILGLLSMPLSYIILKSGGGFYYALLSIFLTMTLSQILALIILKHLMPFSILNYAKSVIFPLVCVLLLSIIIPFLFNYFMDAGWIRFFIVVISSFISVVISTMLIGLDREEKEFVYTIVQKKIRRFYVSK